MTWTLSEDVVAYAAAVRPLLAQSPAEHTIALTIIEYALQRSELLDPPELYGWWTDADGEVTGAMLHTPGYEPLLEKAPDDSLRPLLDALTVQGHRLSGVNGPVREALTFAAVSASALGCRAELGHVIRLFRLDTLRPPDPMPAGVARLAGPDDESLLVDWVQAFSDEAHAPLTDAVDSVRRRLDHDGLRLWLDDAGRPVSMAAQTLPAFGISRIGPVYTPVPERRHGYGAAVTAAVAANLLDDGLTPVLFTDLANPTSNALYQRLGFSPISDRVWLKFRP